MVTITIWLQGLNETNIRDLRNKGFYKAQVEVMDSTLNKLRGTKKIADE